MAIVVLLDGPKPRLSDTPDVGIPTSLELDSRACPASMGSVACAVSKTVYSGCYAGGTLIGEGMIGLPILVSSLSKDFFGTLEKIPEVAVRAVGDVSKDGIVKMFDGHIAEGAFNIVHGAGTLLGFAAGVKGIRALAKKSPRLAPDAFDLAARNPQFGGWRVPNWMLRLVGKGKSEVETVSGPEKNALIQKPPPPILTVADVQMRLEGLGYKSEPRVASEFLLESIRRRYPDDTIRVDELGIIHVGNSGYFPHFKAHPTIIPAGTTRAPGMDLPLELRIDAVYGSTPIIKVVVATCDYRPEMQSMLDDITWSARQELGNRLQTALPEVTVYPTNRTARFSGARY